MYADPLQLAEPHWSGQAQRRLLLTLAMSTFCVATILSVLRLPAWEQARPFAELVLHVLIEEVESVVPPVVVESLDEAPEQQVTPAPAEKGAAGSFDPAAAKRDWYDGVPKAVAATLDNLPREYTVNPIFDEKRRQAAVKFAPSRAAPPAPIWENVAKDALGRAVLWSGDCYRVLDDPNVGSRDAFETFGQYMTMCVAASDAPKELPWVNAIRNRRAGPVRSGRPAAE